MSELDISSVKEPEALSAVFDWNKQRGQKRSYALSEVMDDLVVLVALKSRPLDTAQCLLFQNRMSLLVLRSSLTFCIH